MQSLCAFIDLSIIIAEWFFAEFRYDCEDEKHNIEFNIDFESIQCTTRVL